MNQEENQILLLLSLHGFTDNGVYNFLYWEWAYIGKGDEILIAKRGKMNVHLGKGEYVITYSYSIGEVNHTSETLIEYLKGLA